MKQILLYNRWEMFFPTTPVISEVKLVSPDGRKQTRPVFRHHPSHLEYDRHGYETVVAEGEVALAVRFVPDQIGAWKWSAVGESGTHAEGTFQCIPSDNPGYVEVSPEDSRYFRFSTGRSFAPIGLNLCWPQFYSLPTGDEFQTANQQGTLGCNDYGRWFSKLRAAGGNYARIWVGHSYFNPESEANGVNMLTSAGVGCPCSNPENKKNGELDPEKFVRLDTVVELAREHGIYLKLCLEFFRYVKSRPGVEAMCKTTWSSSAGKQPENMDEWFEEESWQEQWFKKANALTARYGDDPVVMAWELWNEINCCDTSQWDVQLEWTRRTLRKLKKQCPKNLVTNSLGSFDSEEAASRYNDFKMDEMNFQQVHRYLDQGARMPSCQTDPVEFSIDAIKKSRRSDRPVILAETGAVNNNHTGPFRYYRWDDDGLIFHDVVYPAFFAGAAGCGHIWHWEEYVDQKNFWNGYKTFGDILEGVQLDREHFEPRDFSTTQAWALILQGKFSVLGWVRNRADTWHHVLRDGRTTEPIEQFTLDTSSWKLPSKASLELFRPWEGDASGTIRQEGGKIILPPFKHGLLFRIKSKS